MQGGFFSLKSMNEHNRPFDIREKIFRGNPFDDIQSVTENSYFIFPNFMFLLETFQEDTTTL